MMAKIDILKSFNLPVAGQEIFNENYGTFPRRLVSNCGLDLWSYFDHVSLSTDQKLILNDFLYFISCFLSFFLSLILCYPTQSFYPFAEYLIDYFNIFFNENAEIWTRQFA